MFLPVYNYLLTLNTQYTVFKVRGLLYTLFLQYPVLKKLLLIWFILLFLSAGAMAKTTIDSLYDVAAGYFKKGDYASNLKTQTQILELAERQKDCLQIARATLKVGSAYYYLQQRALSLQWMLKGRQLAYKCNIDSLKWISARQAGAIYLENSVVDSAFFYLQEAESLLNKTEGNWVERSSTHAILGDGYYIHKKDRVKANHYYNLALQYALLSGDTIKIAYANIKKGSYNTSEGNCRDGIVYFKRALALYTAVHLPEGMMYATNMLGLAYSKCGDAAQTFATMTSLRNLRDSIFRAETAEKTAEYRTLYETEKKEKENIALTKDNALKQLQIVKEVKTKHTIIILSISGLITLFVVFLLLYYRYKQRKKQEMDERIALQQKLRFKAVLEAEEKERVRIARELHDGLGQVLSAAKLNINAVDSHNQDDDKLMDNAKKLLDDAVREVRSISHNLMPSGLMEFGLPTALDELVSKINDARLLEVSLTIHEGAERLNHSVEIAVYRIVQEVLNNMIKHSKANKVQVLLDYRNDKILLLIQDNGVGFDTGTIEQSSGIGWKNIFSRVYMMNGDITIDSMPGSGTAVNIELSK